MSVIVLTKIKMFYKNDFFQAWFPMVLIVMNHLLNCHWELSKGRCKYNINFLFFKCPPFFALNGLNWCPTLNEITLCASLPLSFNIICTMSGNLYNLFSIFIFFLPIILISIFLFVTYVDNLNSTNVFFTLFSLVFPCNHLTLWTLSLFLSSFPFF